MQFPSDESDKLMLFLLWFYDNELEYFEKKEKICAEFAKTFRIGVLKKQKNVNKPSTKQARLS